MSDRPAHGLPTLHIFLFDLPAFIEAPLICTIIASLLLSRTFSAALRVEMKSPVEKSPHAVCPCERATVNLSGMRGAFGARRCCLHAQEEVLTNRKEFRESNESHSRGYM